MSELTRMRDHARALAGSSHTTAQDAALWFQIADEIDEYLGAPPVVEDLFGEYAPEPEPVGEGQPRGEPEAEQWSCAEDWNGEPPRLGVETWPCGAAVTDRFHETHVREAP